MPIQIRPYLETDAERWDAFVRSHAHGSPFHLIAWKQAIEETFGYIPKYLIGEENGSVVAVLPLFLVENFLAGKVLLSTPFAVYGGVLAASEEARLSIKERLEGLSNELKVDHAELRNAWPEQRLGWAELPRYVTFTQELAREEEAILEAIPRKTRRMVRKALENPFEARLTRDSGEFERLYLANLRKLGTPAFPHRHFANLLKHFGQQVHVREVCLEGKVVSAVMTFSYGDQLLPYYGAADSAYNRQSPTNFMYFDQMRWAAAEGYRVFDFGRSKKDEDRDAGSYGFKTHWGMVERDLPYEILLVRRRELPNLTPKNPKFQLFLKIWQRLPLPVTKILGPWLIRLVP